MNKRIFVFLTIGGALLAIYMINNFLGITYSSEGSFDIITGAFVEVFILTVFFEYAAARDQKRSDQAMQLHLKQIERLLRDQKQQISDTQQVQQPKKKKRKGQKYVY